MVHTHRTAAAAGDVGDEATRQMFRGRVADAPEVLTAIVRRELPTALIVRALVGDVPSR